MSRVCWCQRCLAIADVNDDQVLTSIPPKYSYDCRECGYHGYILCSQYINLTFEENKENKEAEPETMNKTNISGDTTNVYTPTVTGTVYGYERSCPHRLPCGICRFTDKQCSKIFWNDQPGFTCNPTVPTTCNPTVPRYDENSTGYSTVTAQNRVDEKENKN